MSDVQQDKSSWVDYLFIGAGASSTLLLMCLNRRGLLKGKKFLVIDPDAKQINDKTYCFWATPEEPITQSCEALIGHKWNSVSVNQKASESLSPMNYMQISSLRLYEEMRSILKEHGTEQQHSMVLDIKSVDKGVEVITEHGTWFSKQVFNSSPPKYLPQKKNESHLLQSFVGYVISLKDKTVDKNAIDLMDFGVEQQENTQFVYVLPYSENKMLVELTRFGKHSIKMDEAEPVLKKYISDRFGAYTILDTETGCIPMSNVTAVSDDIPGVISIGGRAGAIKPSTGYAFKNMFLHAEKLADSIQYGIEPQGIQSASRFRFYDRLLLLILSRKPHLGKHIFQVLFQKNRAKEVLPFLAEKTNLLQDLRILLSLPIKPFLQALCLDWSVRISKYLTPVLVLIFAFLLWLMKVKTPDLFGSIQNIIFFIGLMGVGIPHGAVDHLLETGGLKTRPNLNFILRYLGAAFLCLLIWLSFSQLAILFFLVYSVWHFGQTDMQEWQIGSKKSYKNWVWGMLLFGIILLGHTLETKQVLEGMGISILQPTDYQGETLSLTVALLAILWGFWEKHPAMVLSACVLAIGTQLPLISAFGLYFIGQHSINGWAHLKKGLKINDVSLYLKALPFTIAAFFMFLIAYYFAEKNWLSTLNTSWETIFFVFISCISFPHVMAMTRFYNRNKKEFRAVSRED
jgi:lycopene beta-cyclase